MKTDIHPKYQDVTFKCACGATFVAGSTLKDAEFHTEICSKCHPFYTGKQKLVDTSGRVDKFMEKVKKAQAHAEKNVKKIDEGKEEEKAKETAEKEEGIEKVEDKEEKAKEEKAKEKKKPEQATIDDL